MMQKANLWILCGLLSLALSSSVLADKPKARKTTVIVINNGKKATTKKAAKKAKTTVVIINGKQKTAKKVVKKAAKAKTTVVIINGKQKAVVKTPPKKRTTVVIIGGNQKKAAPKNGTTTIVVGNTKPAKRNNVVVITGNNKPAQRNNVVVIGGNNNKAAVKVNTGGSLPLCTLRVCALYEMTARGKVSYKCGLKKYRGNCSCIKTGESCGRNWRGKTKFYYQCSCRPLCKQTICARYSAVAKTKSSVKCGWKKGYSYKRCSCIQGAVCAKNWRGANKYNFNCSCK
jgi:hypothetical protein